MRSNSLKIIAAVLIITASAACKRNDTAGLLPHAFTFPSDPESAGFIGERLERVDSMLSYYINTGVLPNAVTFVARKGYIVHHKAYGYRDIENNIPLHPGDIFRIASQTKAVTTVALLTLYEEGRFLLDDPVSKFIPEFKNPRVITSFDESDTSFTTRPASGEITIRQLLNHTSGIHYGILGGAPGNMMFAKESIPAVNSMDPVTIGEVVKKIATMPLMFDPGEQYLYGMNTDVAGYVIEVLSGQTLDRFIYERILEPLGMKDTYFYLPGEKADRLVTLYSSGDKGLTIHPNEVYRNYPVDGARKFMSGGAGLCGTIEDYAKFCQMLLNKGEFNGTRILSRKTVDMMTANQIGDLQYGDYGRRFGLGLDIWSEHTIAQRLGSKGSLRWGGMYYTDYRIDPEEDMILLLYTNVQPWQGPNLRHIFHNMIYQALK